MTVGSHNSSTVYGTLQITIPERIQQNNLRGRWEGHNLIRTSLVVVELVGANGFRVVLV